MSIVIKNVLVFSLLFSAVFSYYVEIDLSHNGPVVLGANITFTAKLTNSLNQPPNGKFAYEWEDDANPPHKKDSLLKVNATDSWTVSYPARKYKPRDYSVTVRVFIWQILYFQVAHQTIKFSITETLNGEISIEQKDMKNTNTFVSNSIPAKHSIKLSEPDYNFIFNHATSVLTFWFVDCVYYGYSTDLSFTFNYTEERTYNIEALVVASYDELPLTTTTAAPPPTTTTNTPTNTTTTNTPTNTTTNTTTPTTTTATSATLKAIGSFPSVSPTSSINMSTNSVLSPSRTSTPSPEKSTYSAKQKLAVPAIYNFNNNVHGATEETSPSATAMESFSTDDRNIIPILKRLISDQDQQVSFQKRHIQDNSNLSLNKSKDFNLTEDVLSAACLNSSFVPPDPNKTYGYFRKSVIAKAPISKVVVKGNNWLLFGDVLNLNISCKGSGRFQHCTKIKIGTYNITGEESCSSPLEGDTCDFSLTHYFREANTYTYIIIISNDISKVVTPAVIQIYKVTVQSQLSVIVVPVTCSLLAIIIIVFGVAYYVQSQNRFTVEVADFDFGQTNDMEYKSFYERLREEISNLFSRSGDFLEQTDVFSRRNKYDNMEES